MLFSEHPMPEVKARALSPRMLAHLGDAVFHLYERERELATAATASQVHNRAAKRASAPGQADLLTQIENELTDAEADIVRRARNVKPLRQRRSEQAVYRRATSFEALLGYLYLTDCHRLCQLLAMTLTEVRNPGTDDHSINV